MSRRASQPRGPPKREVAQASSSSSSSAAAAAKEMEKKLFVSEPTTSKSLRPPKRPDVGTVGRKIVVTANHFLVQVADKELYHYDVTITPEVTSKKTCRIVIKELLELYRSSHFGQRTKLAYDGKKGLYTAGPLPFESQEFDVVLVQDSGEAGSSSQRRERRFKVTVKLVARPDLYHLKEYLRTRQLECPLEALQALDVVLRAAPSEDPTTTVVGRSFFGSIYGPKGELGDGVEYWRGYYQSLRVTQMGLSLNIDVSARAFYEPIYASDFVQKHCNIRDLSRPLNQQDGVKVKKALKGLRVEVTHTGKPRQYRITGISSQPVDQIMFTLEGQSGQVSVARYFRQKYQIALRFPSLNAIQAGSEKKQVYLPMELCKIVDGQRFSRKLNEKQVTNLLRACCQRPRERETNVRRIVEQSNFNGSELVSEEFGIHVENRLASVNARVLPPPMLKYHDSGRERDARPGTGQWNMINKKVVDGGRVNHWAFINFSRRTPPQLARQFCEELVNMCNSKGMAFNPRPLVFFETARSEQIERALHELHKKATEKLQLLVIILPDFKGSYGTIKRVCETELGIVSQCCQPHQAKKLQKQYLENVCLKINVKVGGRNTWLIDAIQRNIPLVTDRPTIIFGADVTHPQPGEDASPSIAAVVASVDWPQIVKYKCLVSAQPHREEIIQDLYKDVVDSQGGKKPGGMIRELLIAFFRSTGQKPHRIIFYRDGVSEGQFKQVLIEEVHAIRTACQTLEKGYLPPLTFVVVQKRHHTRLFPDHRRNDQMDRSGNILAGTVVDTSICHPTEFDFYLNSHAGIQGTSRPSHYHVLYDENNFRADAIQTLTNNLCYTYARCTKSVSVVPPAYYAHLAAFRARYYIEGETSRSGTERVGGVSLPIIHDNVKDFMFYC